MFETPNAAPSSSCQTKVSCSEKTRAEQLYHKSAASALLYYRIETIKRLPRRDDKRAIFLLHRRRARRRGLVGHGSEDGFKRVEQGLGGGPVIARLLYRRKDSAVGAGSVRAPATIVLASGLPASPCAACHTTGTHPYRDRRTMRVHVWPPRQGTCLLASMAATCAWCRCHRGRCWAHSTLGPAEQQEQWQQWQGPRPAHHRPP